MRDKGQWLYCIREQQMVVTRHLPPEFRFDNGWLRIVGPVIVLKADRPDRDGYACDGCSPKFIVGQLLIGVNDGLPIAPGVPITQAAFWAHDALYQFHAEHGLPRHTCDLIFREQLRKAGFVWAEAYYWAVRAFGVGAWRRHDGHAPQI